VDDYHALKARVRELEKQVEFLFNELRIEYQPADDPMPEYERHIRELLNVGNKIEAIKVYREETGAGLAEAKAAVEELDRA
jgi:ribosomal protein L7/L12